MLIFFGISAIALLSLISILLMPIAAAAMKYLKIPGAEVDFSNQPGTKNAD